MKIVSVPLVALVLSGCATGNHTSGTVTYQAPYAPQANQAISYARLDEISRSVSNKNCNNIDANVNFLETQLQLRGLSNATPERLNDEDRKYNATARLTIWALRIGCSNPNRYKS